MLWSFLALVGVLSVVVVTQGDTRRFLLQGAFVGSALGLVFVVGLFFFLAPR